MMKAVLLAGLLAVVLAGGELAIERQVGWAPFGLPETRLLLALWGWICGSRDLWLHFVGPATLAGWYGGDPPPGSWPRSWHGFASFLDPAAALGASSLPN